MGNSKEGAIRKDIESAFSQLQQVIKTSLRPLPTQTGDGTYLTDPNAQTGAFKDLPYIKPKDVETVLDVVKTAATGAPMNDRQYIIERVIQVSNYHSSLLGRFVICILTESSSLLDCRLHPAQDKLFLMPLFVSYGMIYSIPQLRE
jgi:hypothetical protein